MDTENGLLNNSNRKVAFNSQSRLEMKRKSQIQTESNTNKETKPKSTYMVGGDNNEKEQVTKFEKELNRRRSSINAQLHNGIERKDTNDNLLNGSDRNSGKKMSLSNADSSKRNSKRKQTVEALVQQRKQSLKEERKSNFCNSDNKVVPVNDDFKQVHGHSGKSEMYEEDTGIQRLMDKKPEEVNTEKHDEVVVINGKGFDADIDSLEEIDSPQGSVNERKEIDSE